MKAETTTANSDWPVHPWRWLAMGAVFILAAGAASLHADQPAGAYVLVVGLGVFAGFLSARIRLGASAYLGLLVPLLAGRLWQDVDIESAGGLVVWLGLYLGAWHLVLGWITLSARSSPEDPRHLEEDEIPRRVAGAR